MPSIETSADNIKAAWARLSHIPNAKPVIDSHSLAMIAKSSTGFSLSAQNQHVYGGSLCVANCDIPEGWKFFVNAAQMNKIVRNAEGVITMKQNSNELVVASRGWIMRLPSIVAEFNRPVLHDGKSTFATKVAQLSAGLEAGKAATGKADKVFAVDIVTLDMTNKERPVVFAIDGTNSSVHDLPIIEEPHNGGVAKLPLPSVSHAISFTRYEDGIVRIMHDMNNAVIYNDACFLYMRLAEGNVPPWGRIIAANACSRIATVETRELSNAVMVVSSVIDPESPEAAGIRVIMDHGTIVLSARSSQFGSSEATVPYEGGPEGPVEFKLGAGRFAKALARFSEPMIQFGLNDNNAGATFQSGPLMWVLAVIAEGEYDDGVQEEGAPD